MWRFLLSGPGFMTLGQTFEITQTKSCFHSCSLRLYQCKKYFCIIRKLMPNKCKLTSNSLCLRPWCPAGSFVNEVELRRRQFKAKFSKCPRRKHLLINSLSLHQLVPCTGSLVTERHTHSQKNRKISCSKCHWKLWLLTIMSHYSTPSWDQQSPISLKIPVHPGSLSLSKYKDFSVPTWFPTLDMISVSMRKLL